MIEKRALYHLLRMNWLQESNLSVEPWQVEDLRALPLNELFERLKADKIRLDRVSFIAYADECDSPEELCDHLTADQTLATDKEDQIYLLVFELWRRLMSEKPSLSIVCNELDYQIFLYDQGELDNPFALQDAIAHFIQILEENVDEGIDEEEAFKLLSSYCANDVETFLYDFISEQIDEENESYASELLDDFEVYIKNNKWFKLLNFRISEKNQAKSAQRIAQEIIEDYLDEKEIDFNLEFLSVMAEIADYAIFSHVLKQTLPLITKEEEFQDLLALAMDYLQRIDYESHELALKKIAERRSQLNPDRPFDPKDPDLSHLIEVLSLR